MPTDDLKIADPAVYLYLFLDRHLPGHVAHDPRDAGVELFRRFQQAHDLPHVDETARVQDADDLNLVEIDRAGDALVRWINRWWTGDNEELAQAIVSTFGDTMFVQATRTLGVRTTGFAEAWSGLAAEMRSVLGGIEWSRARDRFVGLTVCCSVLAEEGDDEVTPPAEAAALEAVFGRPPRLTETTVGRLWQVGGEWMGLGEDLPRDLLDTWILVSPRAAADEAYRSLQSIRGPAPPTVPLLLWGRNKCLVQLSRYEEERTALRRAKRSLDKRNEWLSAAQRDYEEAAEITGSQESEELRQKSARAHANLADFQEEVSRVTDASKTLEINLRNQEELAARLVLEGGRDEVLGPEHGYLRRRAEQVAYDVSYYSGALERARAQLGAAQARFDISQDRQAARGVRLSATQVSGLFATLTALVVQEVAGLPALAQRRPLLAANYLLLVLVGTFALSQVILAWKQIRTPLTRYTLATAAGVAALLPLTHAGNLGLGFGTAALGVFGAAFALVYHLVRRREEGPRRDAVPRWRRLAGFTSSIAKLRLASEEIEDLLEDLPPTRYYRLKKDDSTLEKIEEKNRVRAQRLGIDPTELERRGQAYTERDIGDAIGIRYVTSPWVLPVTVARVERVLGPRREGTEYKTGRYKSVHVDVDLWGVGAKRDLNLMAEVQVRTYLQDFYASSVHDVLYKDQPEGGLAFLRVIKRWPVLRWTLPFWDRLLALPAAVELVLFRRWMRWDVRPDPKP